MMSQACPRKCRVLVGCWRGRILAAAVDDAESAVDETLAANLDPVDQR
jgi:hypothetical protein